MWPDCFFTPTYLCVAVLGLTFGLSKHEGSMLRQRAILLSLTVLLPLKINISTNLCTSVRRDVVKIKVHLPQRPTSDHVPEAAKKLGYKYLAVDSMLKTSMCDALNKIKRNLKNFLGEYQLCEETWATNYQTKLSYLNKEFPSQFQGLYILLCLSCLT